jgi:hypothetical protein
MLSWTIVVDGILDVAAARIGSFRRNADAYRCTVQGFYGGVKESACTRRK